MAHNKSQGFTLIELMVVVAIIGMLASLAVPVFQDYSARAKLSEIIQLSKTDRTLAASYYSENSSLPDSLESLGIYTQADRSRFLVGAITAVVDEGDDSFTITYPVGNLGGSSTPGTLIWKGSAVGATLQWDCTGGTLPHRYRPPACRP